MTKVDFMGNETVYDSWVNAMLRKVAVAAASNPHVEIRQDGEQFYIKTSTSVRTTEINFHIGEQFDEETVDGRKCKVELGFSFSVQF
uniref:Cellular retinoic acid binding protein 1 n=1 Tax=Seriola lalandi dorsalis TaxID=1841481 RepID=A0A3B4WVN3_SERLL